MFSLEVLFEVYGEGWLVEYSFDPDLPDRRERAVVDANYLLNFYPHELQSFYNKLLPR